MVYVIEVIEIFKGFWENVSGELVCVEKIKFIDKDCDVVVCMIVDQVKQMVEVLLKFKKVVLELIDVFQMCSVVEYSKKLFKKMKGNLLLICFNGQYKVVFVVQDMFIFDECLQIVKVFIDECVYVWVKGVNKNIQVFVNYVFQVDKVGKVSICCVLDLCKLDIVDFIWKCVMDVIVDFMSVFSLKIYLWVYECNGVGEYILIVLDVSVI